MSQPYKYTIRGGTAQELKKKVDDACGRPHHFLKNQGVTKLGPEKTLHWAEMVIIRPVDEVEESV